VTERLNLIRGEQRVSRALRQERRMQSAHVAEIAETKRLGHVRGFVPDSVQELIWEFQDELYFLIVAVRQAVSSRTVLVERGFDLPSIRNEQGLVAWRNIYEHWDDTVRGKSVGAERKWLESGAHGEPGSSWSYNGDDRITEMSGISIVDLRTDLRALRDALLVYEQEAFEMDWPNREQAAAFMHMDLEKFDRLASWGVATMDWSHRGAGVRLQQSDLDAWKAKLIAQNDWPPGEAQRG
jgi:hypothetical protein